MQGTGNDFVVINCLNQYFNYNLGNLANEYLIGDKVDVVGVLETNSFNGNETVQLNLKDMMKSI